MVFVETMESGSIRDSPRGELTADDDDATVSVVWIFGEHDASTLEMISQAMRRVIARDDADIVIDLSGVDFLSAAVLRVFVLASFDLRRQSRSLSLRSPSPCAQRLLELCDIVDLKDPQPRTGCAEAGHVGALRSWVLVPPSARASTAFSDVCPGCGDRLPGEAVDVLSNGAPPTFSASQVTPASDACEGAQ